MLEAYAQHQDLWNDCYLGYVIIPNSTKMEGYQGILQEVSKNQEYKFYPWLDENEYITLPEKELVELTKDKFIENFVIMAKEAISYGSHKKLSEKELNEIIRGFLKEFISPKYYSNFSGGGWNPVTGHSKDSFLCAIDKEKIGMWVSCDDE